MESFDFTSLLQNLGPQAGLTVAIGWLFYRSLVGRVKLLERVVRRHELREDVHLKFIGKLLALIPKDKKTPLGRATDEYYDSLKEIDLQTKSKD